MTATASAPLNRVSYKTHLAVGAAIGFACFVLLEHIIRPGLLHDSAFFTVQRWAEWPAGLFHQRGHEDYLGLVIDPLGWAISGALVGLLTWAVRRGRHPRTEVRNVK